MNDIQADIIEYEKMCIGEMRNNTPDAASIMHKAGRKPKSVAVRV